MNYWVAFLMGVFVSFLVWLVFSKKVPLPLLFEYGLASVAIGLILMACSVAEKQEPNNFGSAFILAGAITIALSVRRQRRKRERKMRLGEPQIIDDFGGQ